MNKTLYNTKDVSEARAKLLKEQNGLDALTKLPLDPKDTVLDHNHDTDTVRGAIHRQANAALGKIENLYKRYLSYWYPGTFRDFLEKAADYIDRDGSHVNPTTYHPSWIKRAQRTFMKQPALTQNEILIKMGIQKGSLPRNLEGRKKAFRSILLKNRIGYDTMRDILTTEVS